MQNSNQPKHTITVKAEDLNTREKLEAFTELFSLSTVIKAAQDLSIQVHGDGTMEKLMDLTESLNPAKEEDEGRYKKLQLRIEKESALLKDYKKAEREIEVSPSIVEKLFQKKELAKEILGERFYDAVYPLGSQLDRKTLRNYNPNFENTKRDPGSYKAVVNSLETEISQAREKEIKKIDNM